MSGAGIPLTGAARGSASTTRRTPGWPFGSGRSPLSGRLTWWLLAVVAGVSLLLLTPANQILAGRRMDQAAVAAVGWSFIAGGLIIHRRRAARSSGALMVVVGLLWFAARLTVQAPWTLVFTAGMWLTDLWFAAFALFVVSCSRTGPLSRFDLALVAPFALAFGPLELLWLLYFDPGEGTPGNSLLIWPDASTAARIDWTQRSVAVAGSVVLVVVLTKRWVVASPPQRRRLTPLWASAAALLLSGALGLWYKISGTEPRVLGWILLLTLCAVPLAVLVDDLRARLARSSVADLMVALRAHPPPEQLRDVLARALGDPSLQLAYWLPEYGCYADLDGRPLRLPDDGARATTVVERDDAPLAALVHDPSLRQEQPLLDGVCAAAGIALENAQLQSELRARLEELSGSRARIVAAAQSERQRLERDLHDGAQQRLVSLSLELGRLRTQLAGDAEARLALDRARGELAESLQELRELARGIHPAVVTGHGLEVALEGLVARAQMPVRLTVDLDGRLPEPVEIAAYYMVSECLTNVARHARAGTVTVELRRAGDELIVEVVDDGVGGADTEGGSGLRGLADRVEALGGTLRVWSPIGGGTRSRAEIPCGS